MSNLYEQFGWIETPRMRWRTIGLRGYLSELGTIILFFVVAFGVAPLCCIALVLKPPWWQHHTWADMLFMPALGLFVGLILGILSGVAIVGFRAGMLYLNRSMGKDSRPLRQRRVVRCVPIRGVLRLEIDVPVSIKRPDDRDRIIVAASPRHLQKIQEIFEAAGAPFTVTEAYGTE